MASAIGTSALGAFQASLSVLITLCYGVLAARWKMVSAETASDISQLCVNMFLPALLVTNIGSEINTDNWLNYVPVFFWSILYAAISLIVGKVGQRLFKLPSWVVPACAFNNTTSLPLLLTKSLTTTGILTSIAGGDVSKAVDRAQSYFLINSMVSNAATFAVGPKLLDIQRDDGEDGNGNGGGEGETDEAAPLLPKPVATRISRAKFAVRGKFEDNCPSKLKGILKFLGSMVNPTLIGAFVAVAVGLIPPIHKALFAETQNGGWLNAWFTSSLENIGQLFTALQMFVVGSKLNDSLSKSSDSDSDDDDADDSAVVVSKGAFAFVFVFRFIFWGLVSIPVIYFLVAKTKLLGNRDDPMLWFSMMLMPIGPPAMIMSSLAEVAGLGRQGKHQIAWLLAGMYAITPIMFLAVVGALKATEELIDIRGV